MGYKSIALNALQAGIFTNSDFGKAKIIDIDTTRILKELENNKIVIVTGFQGIDKEKNFTTLGRGGSDTSAVALAIKLNAEKCYIFSDVDGVFILKWKMRQAKVQRYFAKGALALQINII